MPSDCILIPLSIIAAGIFVAYWTVRAIIGTAFFFIKRQADVR